MSKDWTKEELRAASETMKEQGNMSYAEFVEELKKQGFTGEIDNLDELTEDEVFADDDRPMTIEEQKRWYYGQLKESHVRQYGEEEGMRIIKERIEILNKNNPDSTLTFEDFLKHTS